MRGVLKNRIDANALFNVQNEQYSTILYMAATIPALSSVQVKTSVSSEGHFFLNYFTGSMTTLTAGPVDNTVDYLRAQLRDGGKANRPLFSDYVPLHLFLTPGRRRSTVAGLAGSDSNNLFLPIDFEYLFQANSEIVMEVKNDSAYENSFSIAFFGIRIRASAAVSGIR
jgi:hypothetical protein